MKHVNCQISKIETSLKRIIYIYLQYHSRLDASFCILALSCSGPGETPPATSTCSESKLRATSLGSCCASNVTVSRRPQSKTKQHTQKKMWGSSSNSHNYFMILSYCLNFTKSSQYDVYIYIYNTNLEPK